ncbi:dehydrogenase [Mycena polygramma]|nr:dehydrogenase [Mycena polygramma]
MGNKNEEAAVVLITGCSTGFGRELAKAALSANLRVIATARRPETLDSLKDQGAKTLKLDVTAPSDELKQFAAEALSLFGQVDYLINNAGFLQGGAIEENTHEENLAQFNTNFFGVINVTNAFLPHMRQRKRGTIVNVSSQGQWLCLAGAGIYCASKAAVDAVSATWASELKGFEIRCVSIQLGAFRTSVAESGSLKVAKARIDDSGYDGAHDWVVGFNQRAGKEQGDPALAAAKIIALISDPARTTLPVRLALGDDAYEYGKAFHEKELEELEKWKEVTTGTDVVGN